MKLKSAMIRNRGEGTRVGSIRKHGQCQLSTGANHSPCDQLKSLNHIRLRRRIGRPSRLLRLVALLGNPRCHGKFCRVGYGDSCRRCEQVWRASSRAENGTGRSRCGCTRTDSGRIFDGRDGAPPIESSLSSATRVLARRLFSS